LLPNGIVPSERRILAEAAVQCPNGERRILVGCCRYDVMEIAADKAALQRRERHRRKQSGALPDRSFKETKPTSRFTKCDCVTKVTPKNMSTGEMPQDGCVSFWERIASMDSLDRFEALVGNSYFPYRIDELQRCSEFSATIETLVLPKCTLSDCYASEGFRGRFIDKGQRGNFVFHFVKKGQLEVIDGCRRVGVKAGEFVLFSDADPVQTRQIGPARALALNISATTLPLSSDCLSGALHKPISFRSGIGAILFGLLNTIAHQRQTIDQSTGAILNRSIIDFASSLLLENASGGESDRNTLDRHYARILECIYKHLDNRDLSIGFVAAKLQISRSYLCLILSTQGRRFERIVIEARLERARSMLGDQTGLGMAEIAERVGFASASHFSRSFSREFGMPPLVFRKRLLN
jgi:AraC-like DNA-binding protein